jgi:hypothetical protein
MQDKRYISVDINHCVYGNGSVSDNGNDPLDAAPNDNMVSVGEGTRAEGDIIGAMSNEENVIVSRNIVKFINGVVDENHFVIGGKV